MGVLGLLMGPTPDVPFGRTWYVFVASTAFVVMALVSGALRDAYGRLVLLGLVCCWWGDVLGREAGFVAGALAFLVAHLFFIGGFWRLTVSRALLIRGAVGGGVASVVALAWLWPHLEASDFALVLGYLAVITAMVVSAAGISRNPGGAIVLVGAVVFYVSDIFVARWQFVGGGSINGYFCYPLYYSACLTLARSCALVSANVRRASWSLAAGGD